MDNNNLNNNLKVMELKDLSITMEGNKRIIYGSTEIYANDFVIVRGPNGCGKSTLFKILLNLRNMVDSYCDSISGSIEHIYADGKAFKRVYPNEGGYGSSDELLWRTVYIEQTDRFMGGVSCYDALKDAARIVINEVKDKNRRRELELRLDETVDEYIHKFIRKSFTFGDKDFEKEFRRKSIHKCSGGQQKMINILANFIKADVCDCRLMLMDEPLNNLDVNNKIAINEAIKSLRAKTGVAIIIVTHCHIFSDINRTVHIENVETGEVGSTTYKARWLSDPDEPITKCLEDYTCN